LAGVKPSAGVPRLARTAGLDLDEDDDPSLAADEVELQPARAPVAGQDAQALGRQECGRGLLAGRA